MDENGKFPMRALCEKKGFKWPMESHKSVKMNVKELKRKFNFFALDLNNFS